MPCQHKVRQHQFLFRVYPSLAPEFTPCGSVFLIFLIFCVVLLCVLTFVVPCFDVRYDIHIKEMFYSSLPPVVCMTAHVLLCFLCVCGGSNIFGVFRVKNHDFTPNNLNFSNFRGGARRVRPHWIRPCTCDNTIQILYCQSRRHCELYN